MRSLTNWCYCSTGPARQLGLISDERAKFWGRNPTLPWLPVMERLVERYRHDAQVYLAQAWLAYRAERPEVADSALNQALVVRPGWEEVAMMQLSHFNRSDNRKQILL